MNPLPRFSRKSLLRLPLAITLAAGLATMSLSGCGEEPPPPPPPKKDPPPPPPPPPPELSLQALLQETKADARVTFAESVKISDEPLARSVIGLADGFARGDASKLRSLLDPGSQGVLGSLDASGEWTTATAGIEAVRVVYVGDAGDLRADANNDPLGEFGGTELGGFAKDVDPETKAQMQAAWRSFEWSDLPTSGTPLEIAKGLFNRIIEKLKAQGAPPDKIEVMQKAVDALDEKGAEALIALGKAAREGGIDAPAGFTFDRVVVLAVQDQQGAFLLGWGLGPDAAAVHFGSAPTLPLTKPRASDFDNIGLGAFRAEKAVDATAPTEAGAQKPGEEPAAPAPAGGEGESKPGGPKRKNTPGGPVTIPGSG